MKLGMRALKRIWRILHLTVSRFFLFRIWIYFPKEYDNSNGSMEEVNAIFSFSLQCCPKSTKWQKRVDKPGGIRHAIWPASCLNPWWNCVIAYAKPNGTFRIQIRWSSEHWRKWCTAMTLLKSSFSIIPGSSVNDSEQYNRQTFKRERGASTRNSFVQAQILINS